MTAFLAESNPYAGLPRFDSRQIPDYVTRLTGHFGLRFDSAQTAMFARQLEYIYTQTYDILYPRLKARSLIPVDTRVPSGAESFTYRSYEKVGRAKIVHNYADDFPKSDVKANEFAQKIVSLGASYEFSVQDMRAAAMAGTPLETKKADAARWSIESLLEDLACTGDNSTLTPLLGIANATGILATTKVSPNTAYSGDVTGSWKAQVDNALNGTGLTLAIVSNIVGDILAMYNNVLITTKEIHVPNTLVLPISAYTVLSSTIRSPTFTDDTLMGYVKKVLEPLGVTEIVSWGRLDTAGAGSGSRALMYEKSPENEGLIIPQEFEQFAPQPKGMTWMIPCHMRTGAVEVRYPKSVTYMDGI